MAWLHKKSCPHKNLPKFNVLKMHAGSFCFNWGQQCVSGTIKAQTGPTLPNHNLFISALDKEKEMQIGRTLSAFTLILIYLLQRYPVWQNDPTAEIKYQVTVKLFNCFTFSADFASVTFSFPRALCIFFNQVLTNVFLGKVSALFLTVFIFSFPRTGALVLLLVDMAGCYEYEDWKSWQKEPKDGKAFLSLTAFRCRSNSSCQAFITNDYGKCKVMLIIRKIKFDRPHPSFASICLPFTITTKKAANSLYKYLRQQRKSWELLADLPYQTSKQPIALICLPLPESFY